MSAAGLHIAGATPATTTRNPCDRAAISRCKLVWQKFNDHCHRCQHLVS